MAEVRLRFRRGAYNFVLKTYNRQLLESQNKQRERAITAPSVSAGFGCGAFQDGGLYGADRATAGDSQDSYTRVTPLFGNIDNGNVAQYHSNEEYLLSNKSPIQNIDLHRIYAKLRWTPYTFRPADLHQSLGLCGGHPSHVVFIRAYSGNGARSEPLYKTKTEYYEILEVSPTASHAQIKTAYYKQSFLYHPDRNAGSEHATVRFSEISEAYTVLGNKALRKKYDRGLLGPSDLLTTRPSGKDTGSSEKQHAGSRLRSLVGLRETAFDFDRFIKSHYSEQLQRERNSKIRREEIRRKQEETFREKKLNTANELGIMMMVITGAFLLISVYKA
ncbi:dnaJ homolog subfamily C member 4-like [Notothenia coriiceps]|uniref:DnaJ homolog subfamily C member 4-like n=1 Tax=Notothenia coriiceps TaxID=8208 RepID=A0A6I9NVK3_9TELE|nr:PREDICTED: dnaJ homolog subfamily C member 4-like [Notothenia coriiceps]